MTSFSPLRPEDFELILLALDGALDEAGNELLSRRIVDDPVFRSVYRAVVANHVALDTISLSDQQPVQRWKGEETLPVTSNESGASEEQILEVEKRAKAKLEAFLEEQHRLQEQLDAMRKPAVQLDIRQLGVTVKRWTRRADYVFSLAVRNVVRLAAIVALVLMLMVLHGHLQSKRIVAMVKSTHQAHWNPPLDGNDLRRGPLRLESGYAQLAMTQGADVLLQAPCTLELQSDNQLYLESGSLCAEVPESAHGFTVETPFSKIVDFGTEFGASVSLDNDVEVHVFQGGVGVGARDTRRKTGLQNVQSGKAAVVNASNQVTLYSLGSRPQLFMRDLPDDDWVGIPGKQIDLADLVSNGNGLGTGPIGQGISPGNGHFVSTESVKTDSYDSGYITLPHMPFVDGVFIPDGRDSGHAIVSSTGHVFEGCPDTSGMCVGYISNGAFFQHEPNPVHAGMIGGETYNTRSLPSIGMHPNVGITFDLEALRRFTQQRKIVRFSAQCSISETALPYIKGSDEALLDNVAAEFWVLIDGELQLRHTLRANASKMTTVELELSASSRFLTVMTTQGPLGNKFCWCMLTRPTLEIGQP